jgi:hypothetical protein
MRSHVFLDAPHPPRAVFVFSSCSKLSLAQTKQHLHSSKPQRINTLLLLILQYAPPYTLCTGNLQTIGFIARVWVPMQ